MWNIKIVLGSLLLITLFFSCKEEEQSATSSDKKTLSKNQKKVLLIGTFHYNNPGADVAKTRSFDILNQEAQKELDFIADKIAAFKPTKIFVEWDYDEQIELDSLYQQYQQGTYFANDSLSDFYKKNEIFQLAFRVAKKGSVAQVNAIDYRTEFPFDSLMMVLEKNRQVDIQSKIGQMIEVFTSDFDSKIEEGTSLVELTYYLNTPELRKMSNEFHNEVPLIAGSKDNFIGPYLTSEWYKRNLYMWSLIQKGTNKDDQRIMVLAGVSHAAILKDFIDKNDAWNVVELKSILED